MGGAIAAIHDLVVANGGVPKYYQSNWGGLIAAIRDLHIGGGSSVQVGQTPPGFVPGTPGTPGTPAGPGGIPPAVPGTPGTPGSWVTQPQPGDLWFDERQGRLMVWIVDAGGNGAYWQTNGAENVVHVGPNPPVDANGNLVQKQGQIWVDTNTDTTKVYVVDSAGVGSWQAVSSQSNKAYVMPDRLTTYHVAPAVTFTEDVTRTFGTIDDVGNVLNAQVGDLIVGMAGNGGGIVSAVVGNIITVGPAEYNGPIGAGENIKVGVENVVGTAASVLPTALTGLTYVYAAAGKTLTFPTQVPTSIVLGAKIYNNGSTGGGKILSITDANGDGIPETVTLATDDFIGDLTDNEDLTLEQFHSLPAELGDTWYKPDTQTLAFFNGVGWIDIKSEEPGSQVIIADDAPKSTTSLSTGAFDTSEKDGQIWFDDTRKVAYVSNGAEWIPLTDRKYITQTIQSGGAPLTEVYSCSNAINGFFVDYIVFDQQPNPTIVNAGRILVYHIGNQTQITNVMAQGTDSTGSDVQMGVTFQAFVDNTSGTISLQCVCNNDPAVVVPAPVIQLAVSNWVDPQ